MCVIHILHKVNTSEVCLNPFNLSTADVFRHLRQTNCARMLPVCCGRAQVISHCLSCWFVHSAVSWADGPSEECCASGVCVLRPAYTHTNTSKVLFRNASLCMCWVSSDLGDGMGWVSFLLVFNGVRGFSATDTIMDGPPSVNNSWSLSSCTHTWAFNSNELHDQQIMTQLQHSLAWNGSVGRKNRSASHRSVGLRQWLFKVAAAGVFEFIWRWLLPLLVTYMNCIY